MNYHFTKRIFALLSATLLLLAMGSCKDTISDRYIPEPEKPQHPNGITIEDEGEYKYVEFAFQLPDPINPKGAGSSLKALTIEGEQLPTDISNIRAFVFGQDAQGNATGTCLYEAPITKVMPNSGDSQKSGKITLGLKDNTGDPQVLFFAVNFDKTALSGFTAKGATLEQLINKFTYNAKPHTTTDTWTNGSLPMFAKGTFTLNHSAGAVPTATVQSSNGLTDGKIHFVRSIARVDVGINVSGTQFDETANAIATQPNLKLKDVRYYNQKSKSYIFPSVTEFPKVGYMFPGSITPEGATSGITEVSGATLINGENSPIVFSTITDNLLKRTLYVPERINANGTSVNYKERPCLVVGLTGVIAGEPDTKVHYYRIDFLRRTGTEADATYTYLHILRNHRYLVSITGINGPGFDTPEDAFQGPAANIMYNVVVWNESSTSDVKYDGQYLLGIDESTKYVYNGGSTELNIHTSWPKGWVIRPNADTPEGLRKLITNTDGSPKYKSAAGEETKEAKVKIDFNFYTDDQFNQHPAKKKVDHPGHKHHGKDALHGSFDVVAGRITWTIHIRQLKEVKIAATVYADKECTQQLQYLQLHELGEALPATSTTYTNGKNPEILNDPTKGANYDFGFTGLEAGATRYFYVKTEGPNDVVLTIKSVDGNDRFTLKKLQPQPSDLPAGVVAYSVTAPEIVNTYNKFESRQQEYHVTLHSPSRNVTSEPYSLTFHQRELNAVLVYEKEGMEIVEDGNVALLDGKDRTYYLKSNIDCTIQLQKQLGTKGLTTAPMENDGNLTSIYAVTHYAGQQYQHTAPPLLRYAPNMDGVAFTVKIANDITSRTPKLLLVKGQWRVEYTGSKYYEYKNRTNHHYYVSAVMLPEANSYYLELGGAGVLIPLSQIDKAAEQYNTNVDKPYGWDGRRLGDWSTWRKKHSLRGVDDDDKITAEVIWADAESCTNSSTKAERKPVNPKGTKPLRYMQVLKSAQMNFLLVFPGNNHVAQNSSTGTTDNRGNLVVGIRSSKHNRVSNRFEPEKSSGKKALLWSFHLILMEKGSVPKETYRVGRGNDRPNYKRLTEYYWVLDQGKGFSTPVSFPFDLGAIEGPQHLNSRGDDGYFDHYYKRIGMGYQFGRKDPFPIHHNVALVPGKGPKGARGGIKKFVNHGGNVVDFKIYRGSKNSYERMSVRESVENPMVLFMSDPGYQWMTEGGPYHPTPSVTAEQSSWQIYDIWGGGAPIGPGSQRRINESYTHKTRFDPCPYGFCVPAPGMQSSMIFRKAGALINNNWSVNKKAFAGNIVRHEGVGASVYRERSGEDFEKIFGTNTSGQTAFSATPFATSKFYAKNTRYPKFSVALNSTSATDEYAPQVNLADLVFVRPFVDEAHRADYRLALPPYNHHALSYDFRELRGF